MSTIIVGQTAVDSFIVSSDLTGTLVLNSTTVSLTGNLVANNIGVNQTTTTLNIGGPLMTANLTIGRSIANSNTNIQTDAHGAGNTKIITIGTGGLAGSNTFITIGATSGNSVITFGSNVNIRGALGITFADGTRITTNNFIIDAVQNTRIDYSNTRIAVVEGGLITANANTMVLQGVNTSQNTRMSVIEGGLITANANTMVLQGVNTSQNTRMSVIEGGLISANANTVFLNSLITTSNTRIDSANNTAMGAYAKANAAFNQANTAGSAGGSSGYLANSVIISNTTGFLSNSSSIQYFTSNNNLVLTGNVIIGGAISDSIGNLRTVVQNSQLPTGAYTLVAADAGKHVVIENGSTTPSVTMPVSIFTVGQIITIVNMTSSSFTITAPSSGTMYLAGTSSTGNRTLSAKGIATFLYTTGGASPSIIASGAGLS